MKKLAFFAVCALAIASCTDGVKQANLAAEAQRDSLNSIIAQKESEITDMMTTLNNIEESVRLPRPKAVLLLPNRVRVPTAHSVSVRTCSLSSRR